MVGGGPSRWSRDPAPELLLELERRQGLEQREVMPQAVTTVRTVRRQELETFTIDDLPASRAMLIEAALPHPAKLTLEDEQPLAKASG